MVSFLVQNWRILEQQQKQRRRIERREYLSASERTQLTHCVDKRNSLYGCCCCLALFLRQTLARAQASENAYARARGQQEDTHCMHQKVLWIVKVSMAVRTYAFDQRNPGSSSMLLWRSLWSELWLDSLGKKKGISGAYDWLFFTARKRSTHTSLFVLAQHRRWLSELSACPEQKRMGKFKLENLQVLNCLYFVLLYSDWKNKEQHCKYRIFLHKYAPRPHFPLFLELQPFVICCCPKTIIF